MKKKVSAVSVVMEPLGRYSFLLLLLAFLWNHDVSGLQRPPPRYSQQYMPETSFTCRNKIIGSYYADPESDCQVFHVCVSVAGTIQDYKFLCPNDTAFDQESQTCADWYDVDCEAATLYYASDNFDLYRIGSGLESPHYDAIRSDAEPQDHLQRSESNDPVRSSANAYNRLSSSTYNTNNNRDNFRTANGNGDFYDSKNKNDGEYENARSYKEEASPSEKKKSAIRKINRKQQYNGNNDYSVPSTTIPASSQNSYTGTFYNSNNYNQRATGFASSSTVPPSQETYSNRKQNGQRYSTASSTYRPSINYHDTYSSYQTPSTTVKTTSYNVYGANGNYNQESSPSYTQSTTVRSTNYNSNGNNNKNNYQPFNSPQFSASSTVLPSTNYQTSDYTTFQQKNYNIQRGTPNVVGHHQQSTTASPTVYDNHNDGQYRSSTTSFKSDLSQTTSKFYTNYVGGSYAPTTYSPTTRRYSHVDNGSQTQRSNVDNAAPYYDKTAQTVKSSTQHYDNTKMSKKASQYNNYDNSHNAKYYESSTDSYDFVRNAAAIGFSPVSINHLAETPRSTTPTPRRQGTSNAYNPTTFNPNTQRSSSSNTTPRINAHSSASARPFSSSTKLPASSTVRPKSGKKNDYDYAYYDNTGPLEYDGLELEQVTGSKESSKLSKN